MPLSKKNTTGPATAIRTMEEFALHVGLSRPTVSKYFNDPSSVRKKTREVIEDAIQSSGFRPNIFAVNLKRQKSKFLGVIIPNTADAFYMALTRQIEEIADQAGYFAVVLSSNGRPELQAEAIERFKSINVAGAIVAPLGLESEEQQLETLESRVPVVYVDSPSHQNAPFVGTDNREGFGLIVDYLCKSGKPPAFLGMPQVNRNALLRCQAYEAAMLAAGFDPIVLPIPQTRSWDFERFGHEQVAKLLSDGKNPGTLLCANDRVAFGALLAAWEAGIKVGTCDDCALRIAGHDDNPLARFTTPPLTTVVQDFGEIARLATTRLLALVEGEDIAPDQCLLKPSLVLRGSA
jgi:DNA-binding LacI/PurR family transcriptional regulator